MIISKVVINNWFDSNACLVITLTRISIEDSMIDPNEVRAFNGTKTLPCRIYLKILIGPCKFELSFVVIDTQNNFQFTLWQPCHKSHFV